MNQDNINGNNTKDSQLEKVDSTIPLTSGDIHVYESIGDQPKTDPATPLRRKYALPVNPAPASEPKISKARFSKAAKEKTETHGSATAQKGKQTSVPMQSPNKKWWVRCHPSSDMVVAGLTLLTVEESGMDEIYVLDPEIEFPEDLDNFTTPATVTRAITSQGNEFLWLSKQSPKAPKDSVRRCQAAAKRGWIQVRWNAQLKGYSYIEPRELRRDPVWSDDSMDDLMDKAFGDKFIDRADHPVINALLFPDDEDGYGDE
jgi:hypothetical protein